MTLKIFPFSKFPLALMDTQAKLRQLRQGNELEVFWSYLQMNYRKYRNLVRTQVEVISDPNYLVCIFFKR